jgi:GTP-binding protein HflX
VLKEIGGAERPRIPVLNKADRIAPSRARALQEARPESVVVSAQTGAGLDDLRAAVSSRLELQPQSVRLRFKSGDKRGIAGVYTAGRVVGHEVEGGHVILDAELPRRMVERYREHLV